MNRKRNTIVAIIFTIIIIGVFIFASIYSITKEPTRADIINKELRKQNASWVARDSPREITITQTIEDLEIEKNSIIDDSPIFNQETKNQFYTDQDLLEELNSKKNDNTGLLLLTDTTISPQIYDFDDKINWKEFMTPNKDQASCGSCTIFTTLGALEGYLNREHNFTGNNKFNLSEQYAISYTNFKGCAGGSINYYIKFLSLNSNKNIDDYLKNKIKAELKLENKLVAGTKNLQTRTQLSLGVGEVPFGIPLESQLKYLAYDSCEIINLNQNTKKPKTNMDLNPLIVPGDNRLSLSNINDAFCPDTSDNDKTNNIFIPVKNDNYTKYFIEKHFKIDNSDCKTKDKTKTIQNIKDALKISPLAASIIFYDSIRDYEYGIWSKYADENKMTFTHGIIIVGWGVDKIKNKEYWILKNSWKEKKEENVYFRIWIGDEYTKLECSDIYGFSGSLITKSGKEINALLPIAKEELEQEKQAENEKQIEKQRLENLQKQFENQFPEEKAPNLPSDLNPLNEYFPRNINYSDLEILTNNYCLTITSCLYTKLNNFFDTTETQDNKLT